MAVQDEVYNLKISIPDSISDLIKTSEFQRLMEIHQLGVVYKVFDKCDHTRYSHSIGTYYRAGQLMEYLETNSCIKIPEFEKKCVLIAALLHDIGHGPWSHTWERLVPNYEHEKNSVALIEKIFKTQRLSENDKEHEYGVKLICAFVLGNSDITSLPLFGPRYKFLFEIVNNKFCELDVDKWDYLRRDTFYFNEQLKGLVGDFPLRQMTTTDRLKYKFIFNKMQTQDLQALKNFINLEYIDDIFEDARVSWDGAHIEYNADHYQKIYNLFEARSKLHIIFYQHPYVRGLEVPLKEAFDLFEKEKLTFEEFCFKNLSKITSKDEVFQKLTEETVLEKLKAVKSIRMKELIECFEKNNIEEIKSDAMSVEEKDNISSYWKFCLTVKNAGEKMKNLPIILYGRKRNISMDFGVIDEHHYFKMKKN